MARFKRYRNYNRRTRTRWAPNIQEIGTTTIQTLANTTFFQTFTLAFNPTQVNTAVSQVYTVKRIETSFYIDADTQANNNVVEDIAAYIMYVPQGMNVTADYNVQHPEYVMAYKFLGSPSLDNPANSSSLLAIGQQYQPIRVTTRLSRKLQSGDSVILFIKGNNTSNSANFNFDFHGLVRWWTKAN